LRIIGGYQFYPSTAIQAYFKRQLNKNVIAYVDDVVVKTRSSDTLIADL
jgi:hypothetical protein